MTSDESDSEHDFTKVVLHSGQQSISTQCNLKPSTRTAGIQAVPSTNDKSQ